MSTCATLAGEATNRSRVSLFDGGTGEELFRRGLPDDRKTWSALAITEEKYNPLVVQVHLAFIHAGSEFITTNNYALNPGSGFSIEQILDGCRVAGKLARKAADENKNVKVMGSLSPLVESYRPDLVGKHETGVGTYKKIADALYPFVDVYIAETMSSVEEVSQAIEAVTNLDKPMFCSWTLSSNGTLRSGEKVTDAINYVLNTYEKVNILAVTFNCCEPEAIDKALREITNDKPLLEKMEQRKVSIGAYANRLTPVDSSWSMEESTQAQPMRDDLSPEIYWDRFISRWIKDYGIKYVGGCCGITPEHIAFIKSKLDKD